METSRYRNDLSQCVRCGSCKAFCPTYDETSIEPMGARGRLALLQGLASGTLSPSPLLNDRIFSCTLCGACAELCPAGVDIKEAIYHGRTILEKEDKKRRLMRRLIAFSIKRPKVSFALAGIMQHILRPYFLKKGLIPSEFALPDHSLRDSAKVVTVPNKKGRVALFTGCMVNFAYPHLGESLINILFALGYEVILPATEVCCGAPLRCLGLEEEAKHLAQKNARLFNTLNVEAVLSLCPTCTLTVQREYPSLIGEGIQNAQDISTFLTEKIDVSGLSEEASPFKRAFYHDPCHLKYGLSIEQEPRKLIRDLGIELLTTEEGRCCGFAGTFNLGFPDLSRQILATCIEQYTDTKAEAIITACPGCILQLSRCSPGKPVLHIVEVLEEALVKTPVLILA